MRFISPPSSLPSTLSAALVPVTGFGDAVAGTATNGALFVTVTVAVALAVPDVAVTVNGPPAVSPAVKTPAVSMVPPPLMLQVIGNAVPNWSVAFPVNVLVPRTETVAVVGVTVMNCGVETTVSVVCAVAVIRYASVTATAMVYVPGAKKVAVVVALVVGVNVTAAGTPITDHS